MNLNPKKSFPDSENFEMLQHQIVTQKDLLQFGNLLLTEIHDSKQQKQVPQWPKSTEVRKLPNISPGRLQNLRINGTLTYTKIGGTICYDNTDIDKVLNGNKVAATPTLFK